MICGLGERESQCGHQRRFVPIAPVYLAPYDPSLGFTRTEAEGRRSLTSRLTRTGRPPMRVPVFRCLCGAILPGGDPTPPPKEQAPSWHRLGPLHMSLEAELCGHGAVAIPIVAVASLVAVGLSQQGAQ